MADSTISGLSAAATADRTFELPVNKPGTGENAKVTLEQIINLVSDTISNTLSVAQVRSVTSAELASVTSGVGEIGRASCRERVWMWVVAGAVKKKGGGGRWRCAVTQGGTC